MMRPLAAVALAFVGCAPPPTPSPHVPQPVAIPAQPAREAPVEVAVTEVAVPEPAPEPVVELDAGTPDPPELPLSWSVAFGHTLPFAEAMRIARSSRTAFEGAAASTVSQADGGAPAPRQFERASSLLDLTSRRFAAAYHAPDADAASKLDALREAAAMLLAWSRRLDEVGLARAPAAYRSERAVALTFEDVADGPAKRWRAEGIALVQLCVESARSSRLDTPATRECSAMRQTYARVIARQARAPRAPDAGGDRREPNGCACDPGDPLCSASMSGWCRPD
ncbi:MAG: hypothetical protein KF764_06215 [Labilithrix sp.]|nr:hypothetical protein [Labilithrix sp.]